MTGVPNDATLKVYAATAPERLHELALSADSRDAVRLALTLARQESQDATDWAVRLAEDLAADQDPDTWRDLVRQLAWQLVQRPSSVALKRQFEELTPTALDDPATEVRACLLHEMALRWGISDDSCRAYGERLGRLQHPLAWLPLQTLAFEHRMRQSAWNDGGLVGSESPETLRAGYPEPPPTLSGARTGRAARRVPDDERTTAAMTGFAQLGAEAAFYTLAGPLDPADFNAALLSALDAECLDGVTPQTLTAVHTTADDVAEDLFTAAFGGGMWEQGRWGAYARLATWRSLYALMDLDPDVSHYEAVRIAADHRWLRFAVHREADNDWFFGDLSDTAFAVLDPTRTRIAVIAATDTD
ncbi:DUF6183 family protein [Streptomyces cavernicola]|uniref:DUF6183 family protein n=1 Tax=Streptomyces cavernicola TaxID=3043613 RepID=A0ABT6SA33_9ACTN|nr:DUF6183 family protein [Streptomyces sp. B-S-A6]MDI3405048.1 DUF6183 family protein [Streptomyces sp. B-S-A6]